MKASLVVFAVVCAMAAAEDHSVRVAEQPNQGYVITNPDPGFYRPSNGPNNVNIVPDQAFYRPSNGNGVNIVPDSGFANPGYGGGVQPSFGPTFVNPAGRPPYPYKDYGNPQARGGK